jgi:uncharacterized membrane protein
MWFNCSGATWLESTSYHVNLTGFEDLFGNVLIGDVQFLFTTIGDNPFITTTTPINAAINVPVNVNIVVDFSESMNTGSVTYSCSPDPLGWIPVWSMGNTRLTLSHNNFAESTLYQFQITAGQDVLGNALVPGPVPNPWTFQTASNPTITNTVPVNGATGVLINANVVITFSEPMNIGTVAYDCAPNPGGWTPTWSGGDTILTLTHTNFSALTLFTFTITGGQDMSGNNLVAGTVPNPWTFTTEDIIIEYIVIVDVNGIPIGDLPGLTTDDNAVMFYCFGYDQYDNYVQNVSVNWAVTGGIGVLSASTGESTSLECTTPGVGLLVAYNTGATLIDITGNLTVAIGTLTYTVTPDGQTITADDTQQFTATVQDADGNSPTFTVTWTAADGVIDTAGLFTPQLVGTWNISADFGGGIIVNVTITVGPGALAEILITPDGATITMDNTQQYAVTGEDANGNAVTIVAADISWDTQDGAITNTGLYTPANVGTWTIFVIVRSVLNTTSITVQPGAADQIVITPQTAEITADETQLFTVSFLDAYGNPTTSTAVIVWAVSNGTIANGLFTPWNTGLITIWANATGMTGGTAQVTVTAGAVHTIILTPTGSTRGTRDTDITVGDSIFYTAEALDWAGNPVPVAPSLLTWTTTVGTVSNGFFTALTDLAGQQSTEGLLTVVYDDGVTTVQTDENITVFIGILHHIVITDPTPSQRIEAGEYRTFGATGYDIYNNEITGIPFTWTVNFGTIDNDGQLHATDEGVIVISALSGSVTGTYSTYVPVPAGIFTSWLWLVIVLLVVVIILVVLLIMARRKEEEPEEEVDDLLPVTPEEVPDEFMEPLDEEDEVVEEEYEETVEEETLEEEGLGELEEPVEPVKTGEAESPTPEETAEQQRVQRCEKMLITADILPDDKERLKLMIPTGISAGDFTNEIKEAIEKKKKKEEEKDFSSDEKASLLEEELAAELAELEEELGEEEEDDDLEERILQEIEDLEDL